MEHLSAEEAQKSFIQRLRNISTFGMAFFTVMVRLLALPHCHGLTLAIIYYVTMSGIPSVMSCYAEVREVKYCVLRAS